MHTKTQSRLDVIFTSKHNDKTTKLTVPTTVYKLGVVVAKTKSELSKKVVNHLGLGLANDKNVGRTCYFKHSDCLGKLGLFEIICVQKMWDFNKLGKYVPNCVGYRVVPVNSPNHFGYCMVKSNCQFVTEKVKTVPMKFSGYDEAINIPLAQIEDAKKIQREMSKFY